MSNVKDIESPGLPRARIGAFRGTPPELVSEIGIEILAGGEAKFFVSGDTSEAKQILSHLTQNTLCCSGCSASEALSIALGQARKTLTRMGYQMNDLSPADLQVTFEFDSVTGMALAASKSSHVQDQVDQEIHKRIFESLADMFPRAVDALAAEISRLTSNGAHQEAATAVRKARNEGVAFLAPPPTGLLDALRRIDTTCLVNDMRVAVYETRMAVALRLREFEAAERDARMLLDEESWADKEERASLENIIAIAANARGEVETALSIWRRLSSESQLLLPGERGWVWRNISLALARDDVEARQAARLSVDAFLEAGDKVEAAASLMQLSRLLEHEDPSAALKQLDAMVEIVDQHGLIGEELRASLHHARGRRLLDLGEWEAASKEAERAIERRRGVLGAEDGLISSLHLALIAAKKMERNDLCEEYDAEAKKLEEAISSKHFSIARRIAEQFENFDPQLAESLLLDARAFGSFELISAVQVMVATLDPGLTVTERLGKLEGLLRESEKTKNVEIDTHPVKLAIASVLRDDGQYARAASWLRGILNNSPLDMTSRDMLLDCLWKSKDWRAAADFLREQIAKHGERQNLMYAYGRSLVESGDYSSAVSILTKALRLSKDDDEIRHSLLELREHALGAGGTIVPALRESPVPNCVTRDELEQALHDYAEFVASDKRMMFWTRRPDGTDYEWTTRPEKLAQDFLHAFLKARFRSRISVFEELATGAGRLDILLKFDGGLSAVIELKMCGFRYSSAYAASGEEQIQHYMENRSCHLGYLVVHDSRLDLFASALMPSRKDSRDSVREIFVDVRPRARSGKLQSPPALDT